jgi:hypothetical protein
MSYMLGGWKVSYSYRHKNGQGAANESSDDEECDETHTFKDLNKKGWEEKIIEFKNLWYKESFAEIAKFQDWTSAILDELLAAEDYATCFEPTDTSIGSNSKTDTDPSTTAKTNSKTAKENRNKQPTAKTTSGAKTTGTANNDDIRRFFFNKFLNKIIEQTIDNGRQFYSDSDSSGGGSNYTRNNESNTMDDDVKKSSLELIKKFVELSVPVIKKGEDKIAKGLKKVFCPEDKFWDVTKDPKESSSEEYPVFIVFVFIRSSATSCPDPSPTPNSGTTSKSATWSTASAKAKNGAKTATRTGPRASSFRSRKTRTTSLRARSRSTTSAPARA